ncbi:hypothetical protein [Arthrobacter sp. H20]|uniref:hypothetical protein n=1 Tax=Arthrobacter sp. H20 TaxID=1267981 RepID=UPI0004ACAC68|nr:hypothetical protein [Arthrobacter sp. H20]
MRTITRASLVLAGSAALVGAMALPASAVDTTTTAQINAGTIGFSSFPTSAALGAVVPGATVTTSLVDIQVTDNRAGTAGWVASVSLSNFTGAKQTVAGTPDNVIPAANASYTPAAAIVSGTATLTASGAQADLSTAKSVQTASAVTGNHVATWGATLALTAPSNALADTYTAVLTHSVL